MRTRSIPGGRHLALVLGIITLADVAVLFVLDGIPRLFTPASHGVLAAFALAMIAVAYLIFQWTKSPAPMELAKAVLLAAAFLFWAANQFWPDLPQAGLFNDIAIGLFVLDLFFVISGRPADAAGMLLADQRTGSCAGSCSDQICSCANRGGRSVNRSFE